MKMKRMTGTVYSLLKCSLRTTQLVTVLRKSGVYSVNEVLDQHGLSLKRKLQNINQHSWRHLKDWKQPESTYINLIPKILLYVQQTESSRKKKTTKDWLKK
jgi:hypothetical protein